MEGRKFLEAKLLVKPHERASKGWIKACVGLCDCLKVHCSGVYTDCVAFACLPYSS